MNDIQQSQSSKQILFSSFASANAQYPVLLKTVAYILFYLAVELLIVAVLIVGGYFLRNVFGIFLRFISIFYLLILIVKFNGGLGLAFGYISTGEVNPRDIGWKSLRGALPFFYNALRTGVLLFFGQIIMVCPCFLFLTNFIYSPFLFVYENIRGEKAERRSVELSGGSGWLALNRTIMILSIAYAAVAIAIILLIALKLGYVGIAILILLSFYLGLVQINFIRKMYLEALERKSYSSAQTTSAKYKVITSLSVFLLLLFYIAIKLYLKWKS